MIDSFPCLESVWLSLSIWISLLKWFLLLEIPGFKIVLVHLLFFSWFLQLCPAVTEYLIARDQWIRQSKWGFYSNWVTGIKTCQKLTLHLSALLINNLFDLKGYNRKHLVRDFPSKSWNVGLLYQLLQKLWVTGWVGYCSGSSRWCSNRIADNIDLVELVLYDNSQAKKIFAHCT